MMMMKDIWFGFGVVLCDWVGWWEEGGKRQGDTEEKVSKQKSVETTAKALRL